MLLKALLKSSRSVQLCSAGEKDISWEVAWMIASQPPLTQTPSWQGVSEEKAAECAVMARDFEVRCRSTSPTAMGRSPPLLFGLARRLALQRKGRTGGGVRPDARKFTKAVREESTWFIYRWLGCKPDGPGAEPLGNDFTPFRMTDSVSFSAGGTGLEGRARGADCGCLLSISCRASSEGATNPSEVRAFIALLYWPSSTARFALLMLCLYWLEDEDWPLHLERHWPPAKASVHKVTRSPSNHLLRCDFICWRISRQGRRMRTLSCKFKNNTSNA